MKIVRAICILAIAFVLIHTVPAASRIDVVSGATKTTKPAPAPTRPSVSNPTPAPPAVYFFRIVRPDGTVTMDAMTDAEAKTLYTSLMEEHKNELKNLAARKAEWEKLLPNETFPVPPLNPPKLTRGNVAPADSKARQDAIQKFNDQPKAWDVVEITQNGTTEVSQVTSEMILPLKNKTFDSYRVAVIKEKTRRESDPKSAPVKVARPAFKVLKTALSDKEAKEFVAKRQTEIEKEKQNKEHPPAAATQPAAAAD